ncbi:hypothetical protein MZM54_02875 [[Brevibacterium] frigoritolerans]|nr:hypothetical protein [Peribacillus frigoritolerans]
MKVRILKSGKGTWYENAINETFDVTVHHHPTFGYLEYILENTQHNQRYFKRSKEDSALALLFLRDGFTGIKYDDAIIV